MQSSSKKLIRRTWPGLRNCLCDQVLLLSLQSCPLPSHMNISVNASSVCPWTLLTESPESLLLSGSLSAAPIAVFPEVLCCGDLHLAFLFLCSGWWYVSCLSLLLASLKSSHTMNWQPSQFNIESDTSLLGGVPYEKCKCLLQCVKRCCSSGWLTLCCSSHLRPQCIQVEWHRSISKSQSLPVQVIDDSQIDSQMRVTGIVCY